MRPAIGVLVLTLGLLAEGAAYGWSQPQLWVPDLAVGLVWCVVGLKFWTLRPGVSFLALGVGITWFLASLVPATVFWHRGLLIGVLLVLAFAGKGRVLVAAVVFVLLASITPRVWVGEGATIALAGLLLVVTAGLASRLGRTTLARAAQSCLVVTCLALIASALTRLAAPEPGAAALPTLFAYEATLVIVALVVLAAAGVKVPHSVADRVLELSDGPASSLRDALAEVLDDPNLQVGYWRDHGRGYTDLEGQPVVPPRPGTGRAGLPIHEAGLPVALVVHDARLQDDPRLAAAVELATRLATANADLRARVRQRREELAASRGRLVRASDEEREHLASLLRVGPQARLTGLLNALRGIPDATPNVGTAAARVAETLEDLGRWERGLHPRDLQQGLHPALDSLASASRIPVTLTVSGARVPAVIEPAIYYVCAEALANVAKHSAATRVTVRVVSGDDQVTVEVTDDGTGGADPGRGTGLRGVRDRLEAFGGTMSVTAAPGGGTRLSGVVPLSLGVPLT